MRQHRLQSVIDDHPREPRDAARRRRTRERALDAAASGSLAARYGIGPAASTNEARRLSAERAAERTEMVRLNAYLEAARVDLRHAEFARAHLAVANIGLHAGYADALDRIARLMRERDALAAQTAALSARLARIDRGAAHG